MVIVIISAFALVATAFAIRHGVARQGLSETAKLGLQMLPVLVPAFVLAGMMSALIPPTLVSQWLGQDAGLRGLLIATLAGALTPAGPFVAFPLLAVLLKSGASVGAVSAYLSAWALLGVHRVIALEIPLLGWRFALVRYAVSLAAPLVIGFCAQLLSAKLS
jgi:uncharacterized membrane protein YraQ (UPF0718 family)